MVVRTDALPEGDVARRALRAVAWNYIGWFLGKAAVLVSTAVLARVLSPAEFGLVGFATVAIAYLAVLQDLGLGAALIQRRDDIDDAADTVFTFNLSVGAVLAIVTVIGAPLVGSFFDEPDVVPLVRVLGLTFVLNALSTTHGALLERRLSFARKTAPDVGSAVVKGVVAITCASLGMGAWSLVIGQVAGSVAAAGLSWAVLPWRPRLRIHRPLIRSLTKFGGVVMVADLVHAVVANLDYVIVGKVLGGTLLGIYVLSYRLPQLLLLGVVAVLNRALFPAFAEVQDRQDALRRGVLATARYLPMVVVPIGIGLIVAAEPIVLGVLGDQWRDAIPVMRVVAASAVVSSLMVSDGHVYKATGRPGVLAGFALLKLVLLVPALLIGVHHGLVWVAMAHLVTTAIVKTGRAVVAARIVDVSIATLLREMRPVVVPATALLIVASALTAVTGSLDSVVRLAVIAIGGAATYIVLLVRREGDSLRHIVSLVRKRDSSDAERETPGEPT